jgi:DNA (cytosine-5)-methyltransferase 1
MAKKPTVISLYTGAGGLDYGFEAAGFRTCVALEFDADCCKTLRHNRRWPVIESDIFAVPTDRLLEAGKLKKGEADLLIGGPPCQPFSKSAYWASGDTSRLDDPRASTLAAYMRVVEEALPRAFVLENVEGLGYTGKSEGLDFLLDHIRRINRRAKVRYVPSFRVLKAADYGVPQLRARFFMVASREGTRFDFPKPTHFPQNGNGDNVEGLPPYRTAWDALADAAPSAEERELLTVRGKWAGLLPSIPEGKNYLYHTDRGDGRPLFGWRRRYWSFLLKLAKDLPSWTIQAQPGPAIGPFHWESRRLGMRELCRIQTFPDDVVVLGPIASVQKQVGNAVASLLAEVLGREIRHQLLGLGRLRRPLKLLPTDRSPAPPPEPFGPVPAPYLDLIGDHPAHPGTGKGYGAQARS